MNSRTSDHSQQGGDGTQRRATTLWWSLLYKSKHKCLFSSGWRLHGKDSFCSQVISKYETNFVVTNRLETGQCTIGGTWTILTPANTGSLLEILLMWCRFLSNWQKRDLAEISLQQWAENFTAVCDCPSEVGCHFFRSRDFLSVLFVVGISL